MCALKPQPVRDWCPTWPIWFCTVGPVKTGWQRGPFFEVQAEQFALIAVDTGVLRSVDSAQWAWLKAALERAFSRVCAGSPPWLPRVRGASGH